MTYHVGIAATDQLHVACICGSVVAGRCIIIRHSEQQIASRFCAGFPTGCAVGTHGACINHSGQRGHFGGEGCRAVCIDQNVRLADIQRGIVCSIGEVALYYQNIICYQRLVITQYPKRNVISCIAGFYNGLSCGVTYIIGYAVTNQFQVGCCFGLIADSIANGCFIFRHREVQCICTPAIRVAAHRTGPNNRGVFFSRQVVAVHCLYQILQGSRAAVAVVLSDNVG